MLSFSTSSIIPMLIIVGFFSSILASLIGLGGGVASIPLILLIIGEDKSLEAKLIAYVSIFVLAIFALHRYIKQKRKPVWNKAILIGLGVVPATVISELYLGTILEDYQLYFHMIFSFLVLLVIILINSKKIRINLPLWSLPIFGLIIGVATGSMGISGGVLFIPLLVIGLGMNLKKAAINSLFLKILASASNIIVGLASGQYGEFEANGVLWYLPLIIIIGSIPGSFIGPVLSKKMSEKHVSILFNIVMTVILIWEIIVTILISQGIM